MVRVRVIGLIKRAEREARCFEKLCGLAQMSARF
jgi:hypothetical protein